MIQYEQYLGIKYKFNGISKEDGFDCITLVHQVAKDNGVYIPNINHEAFNINNFVPLMIIEKATGDWFNVERQPKVAVVFKIAGMIRHIGFMIDNDRFIHIMKDSNVSIEKLSSPHWNKRVEGFYKYKGSK